MVNRDRFPMPAYGSQQSFMSLFNTEDEEDPSRPAFSLVIDEANKLDCLPSEQIGQFLVTAKDLQGEEHGILSLVLVGTEALRETLKHRSWDPAHQDSPFTHVGIFQSFGLVFALSMNSKNILT